MSFPLLVLLDETTLFYHTLSVAKPSKAAGLIKSRAANLSDLVHLASKTKAPASTRTTSTTLNNPKAHTTATSSVVVVSGKIKVKSEPVDNVQGFADEDEAEE
jgi:lipopolysaccharide export system protein LptA